MHTLHEVHSHDTVHYGGVLALAGALGERLHARLHHVHGVHGQRRRRPRQAARPERPPGPIYLLKLNYSIIIQVNIILIVISTRGLHLLI